LAQEHYGVGISLAVGMASASFVVRDGHGPSVSAKLEPRAASRNGSRQSVSPPLLELPSPMQPDTSDQVCKLQMIVASLAAHVARVVPASLPPDLKEFVDAYSHAKELSSLVAPVEREMVQATSSTVDLSREKGEQIKAELQEWFQKEAIQQVKNQLGPVNKHQVTLKETGRQRSRGSLIALKMEEALESEIEREIQCSCWEACLLAFVDGQTCTNSVAVLCITALNFLVQVVFIKILMDSFTMRELPPLEDMKLWRQVHGHNYENYLQVSQSSLTSAVCAEDSSLIVSSAQQQLYSNIMDYTSEAFGLPKGALLSAVTVFLWFHFVVSEIDSIISLLRSLLRILGSITYVEQSETDRQSDKPFTLVSISKLRFALFGCFSCCRLIVALLLLYVGSVWLGNTVEIAEMILNCTALAFLLLIDELLWTSLAPAAPQAMIRNLQPLRSPPNALWVRPAFAAIGSVVVTGYVLGAILLPGLAEMRDIADAMCGGAQDFVVGPSAFDLLFSIKTVPFSGGQASFGMEAVNDWVEHGSTEKASTMPTFNGFLKGVGFKGDPDDFVNFYGNVFERTCSDWTDTSIFQRNPFLRTALEYQTGEAHITNCSDLASKCDDATAHLLRLLCPSTCGCDHPLSGLYRDGISSGCSIGKCRTKQSYKAALNISCADMNKATLDANPAWQRFWTGFVVFRVNSWPVAQSIADDFRSIGCNAFQTLDAAAQGRVCIKTSGASAMTTFCPVSCGCLTEHQEGCPSTCPSTG